MSGDLLLILTAASLAIATFLQRFVANGGASYENNQKQIRHMAKTVRFLIVLVIVFIVLFCVALFLIGIGLIS